MTHDEITATTDVSLLYDRLQAARAADDQDTVRRVERRLRDLAGHNTRTDHRGGKAIAADPAAIARIRNDTEGGGGA